jgi:hypothetical protein
MEENGVESMRIKLEVTIKYDHLNNRNGGNLRYNAGNMDG